jgi:hypothetical protein
VRRYCLVKSPENDRRRIHDLLQNLHRTALKFSQEQTKILLMACRLTACCNQGKERIMSQPHKLELISVGVLTYTLLAAVALCYLELAGL